MVWLHLLLLLDDFSSISIFLGGKQRLRNDSNATQKCYRALRTMAVGRVDKGFEQYDWCRAKVCLLGLHTRGQWPMPSTMPT